MKKVSVRRVKVSQPLHFHPLVIGALTFCLGVVAVVVLQQVFAGNNDFIIHSCVDKTNGNLRIVAPGTSCRMSENPLDWNQQGPQGPQGPAGQIGNIGGLPYMCSFCNLSPYANSFIGKDFSKAQLNTVNFTNVDLSGVNFSGGIMEYVDFSNDNLTNADFSNIVDLVNWKSIAQNFTSANLTGVNFSNSDFSNSSFNNANFSHTNLSYASLIHDTFLGATNMSTANVTGVTWANVTCPDGSNSDNNGNTCVGHF
ncbi:MAG: pentapeptide repeat-containing protein [Patescibacteria group bacterium]|nr:pentapeptide repeat-containing protein [Patescibacteria group bacterium]